ncbi:APC family permease [Thermoplasmatales archaeon AK]|nr:APC family permease [Thermoplasmatales archaeon AK]
MEGQIAAETVKSDKKLRKELGTIDLLFLSLGGIIGSGWLFAASGAAVLAGPSAIISWLIGGIIILLIALVYAEIGSMLPRSGGIVRYAGYSHGGLAGYMFAWAYFLSAVSVPAVEAEAVITYAGTYINSAVPILALTTSSAVLTPVGIFFAALLTLLFFFLNYAGIRVMGKTNTGITWWKLIIPVATVLVLIAVRFNASNLSVGGFTPYGLPAMFQAIALSGIVFSYLGFRQGVDYAGEAKNPQHSVPIATVVSVIIGMLLYIGLQVAFIGSINWAQVGLPPGDWAGFASAPATSVAGLIYAAPFAQVTSLAAIAVLPYLLYADAYVSPSGTLNVYLGTSQRTIYGMGTNGYLPTRVTKINEKTRVPVIPLVASFVITLIFFAPFPSWYKLVGFITSSTVFTYIVGGTALRVFRRHAGELDRPFKLPGSKILSPAAFIGATLIVYWSGWPLVGYLAIAVFLGLVVYGIMVGMKWMPNIFTRKNFNAGVWVPVYIVILAFLSLLGDTSLGGLGVVHFPWDFLVVGVTAFIFYLWSVFAGYRTEDIDTIVNGGLQFVPSEAPYQAGGGKK